LYVGVWSGNVLAISTSTGTRKWTFRCGNEGVVASPSIMSDGA
jgi:outer membrane protein assembly factor BamB